jgi:hypothetical protein
MIRIRGVALWLMALVMGSGIGLLVPIHSSAENKGDADTTKRIQESYGKLPLSFEVNQGQTDPAVKFLSRGQGYGLFLKQNEAILALTRDGKGMDAQATATLLHMRLVGAKAKPTIVGLDPLPGKSHYLIGNDPKQWHTNVAQYGKVKYQAVYPGIDLVYYGNQQQLEYDLVVAPGADPKKIRLAFQGVKTITIDKDGQLVLDTGDGKLIQRKPIVYQEINGERRMLDGRYVLKGKQQVGFQVARYDRSKPLIIDPVLAYSTFLGESACSPVTGVCNSFGDAGFAIAVDSAGSAYVTGRTFGLPIVGGFDGECGGPRVNGSNGTFTGVCINIPYQSGDGGGTPGYFADGFVAKLNPNGTLSYSTYLGGQSGGMGLGIAVDSTGHAYVTGGTNSQNFPTTPGAYDTSLSGYDGFVSKLAPDGASLVYSTLLGGSASDNGAGIAVDATGNAYVTGVTTSVDFPTVSAAQGLAGGGNYDAFVAKLNPAGTNLVYSTFVGGSGNDNGAGIALSVAGDGSVNAHVTGSTTSSNFPLQGAYQAVFGGGADAFVTKLNAAGTAFDYSTYVGGTGNDYGYGIALDSLANGWNVYVTGSTASTNFPTTTGAFTGAFVTKVDLDAANQLVYSTNPGGSSGNAIAVTSAGNAYVAGANGTDAFVTQLDAASASQVYTFALGGSGGDAAYGIAVDSSGNAYVTGVTGSTDYPVTPGVAQPWFGGGPSDIFVSKVAVASAVKLSAAAYSVNEVDGTVTITVNRIGSTSGEVSVQYSTSNGSATGGSDFTAVTNDPITFVDGDDVETRSISITNDTVAEEPETFTVTLSNPSPTGTLYLNSPGSAVVTITDDDPGVAFSAPTYTVGEEAGTKRIYVDRTGTAGGAFTVQYATSEGTADEPSDYTHTSGTLNFVEGDSQEYFDVPIINDTNGEAYETINLTLSSPTGGAVLVSPYTATLTIVDNDDSLQPIISGVAATIIGTYHAIISWTTDQPADSQVEYGPGYGIVTPLGPALVTSHSVTLTGLSANTTYPVRVKSRNAAGQLNISDSSNGQTSFTTLDAPPPTVTGVSPSSVVRGVTASQSITISGTNFVLGATITVGSLSGTTVTGSVATATVPYVWVNSSNLRFWWPNASLVPASYDVVVTNPLAAGSQLAVLANGFTVTAPQPIVTSTSISPTYGVSASQSVTISGDNFVLGSRITVGSLTGITVSGSLASATTPFVYVNRYTLRFWWPNTSLAAGSYTVQVVNPDTAGGLGANLVNGFTVVAPQPTITSTSPNPVTYGITPNSSTTISGSDFVLGATITVGSLSGTTVAGSVASATTPYVFVNSSTLRFWWPNTSLTPPGPRDVVVTNPTAAGGLSATLTNGFTVNAPQPTVTSTSPNPVTYGVTPNSSITISGSNFVLGATITVGSLSGTTVAGSVASATTPYVFVSSSTLRFWWPNTSLTPPGPRNVVVTNPTAAGALSGTLAGGFTVNAPQPTVTSTSVSPTYGITPSQSISILGTNFVLGATITVGGLSGTTVSGSAASATTPFVFTSSSQVKFWWANTSLTPNAYTVQVTNPTAAGGLSASLASGFTVVAPQPTVTSVSLSPVTYGGTSSRSISIFGTNFLVGSTITVGSLSGTTVSGSTATASVPYVWTNSTQDKFWWNNTSLPVGTYDVTVTNPAAAGGLGATLTGGFVVQ